MPSTINPVQCALGTLGAFFLGARTGNPYIAGGTAAAGFITNNNCGLGPNPPGTYTSTQYNQDGSNTVYTTVIGASGNISTVSITTNYANGAQASTTFNADGTTTSTYTPPPSGSGHPATLVDDEISDLDASDDDQDNDPYDNISDPDPDPTGGGAPPVKPEA